MSSLQLAVRPEVARAVSEGRPVVALEELIKPGDYLAIRPSFEHMCEYARAVRH